VLVDNKTASGITTVGELCTTPFRVVVDGVNYDIPLPPYSGQCASVLFVLCLSASLIVPFFPSMCVRHLSTC
jgi:hypothetical protein